MMENLYMFLFIPTLIISHMTVVSSLPIPSEVSHKMTNDQHKLCNDMVGIMKQSGKDGLSAVIDTVKAAGSAVGFCAVECLKIFEKAIKSLVTLNFKELANQFVKFGECFVECVKQVLKIFKVGFQGANKVKNTLLGGMTKPNMKLF